MKSILPTDAVFPGGIDLRTELAKTFMASLLESNIAITNSAEDKIRTIARLSVKSADILIKILNNEQESN